MKVKYNKLSRIEKILDLMLVFAIVSGLMLIFLDRFINPHVMHVLHVIDQYFILVFLADMARNYFKLGTWRHFIKHHWLDVTVAMIVLITLTTVLTPAIGRVFGLLHVERIHQVTKFYHLKGVGEILAT